MTEVLDQAAQIVADNMTAYNYNQGNLTGLINAVHNDNVWQVSLSLQLATARATGVIPADTAQTVSADLTLMHNQVLASGALVGRATAQGNNATTWLEAYQAANTADGRMFAAQGFASAVQSQTNTLANLRVSVSDEYQYGSDANYLLEQYKP